MQNQIFYQAAGARTGDVIPKYIDGKYQLFYLKGWKDPKDPEAVHGWHRMESTDLVHMSGETPIHVQGGTGDLIYWNGQWHLFSCIFPEGKQLVTHYVSADGSLDRWQPIEEDTFGPDGVVYDFSDWRDPRIIYREDLGEFWMLLAARVKERHSQTGCVGLCVSRDLRKWEYRDPVYYPARFNGACECPDIFRMGNWYYLVFSSYTNLFGTYYVKCAMGEEEWQIPKNHRLDSRAFYAAKTAGKGEERYLFGWNPTKEENIFGFWPDKLRAKDYRTWDWGGSMVIHQLKQEADGDLMLAMPQAKRNVFNVPVDNVILMMTDGWEIEGGRYSARRSACQQMMLMQDLPESCYLKAEIQIGDARQAGVILQADDAMKEGYYLYLEPERKRMVFRSWLRMSEEGGKTFPYDVELEVPVRETEDRHYCMEILMEGSAATAYVNSEAALSFRMYDFTERKLGLFSFGKADFSNILMKRKGEVYDKSNVTGGT